ncbi:hypothetical protein SDC9_88746 [bioreactor metagenome]|uniref:HK97 gp10 family phage protein n=1 Tax=bioreactor metagenome TaxID=1076179 RepID=A0A644ZWY0_9ZZZZ
MIRVKCTGDFNNTMKFLERARKLSITDILNRYGQEGVKALSAATPKDTGDTASKWGYEITTGKNKHSITWTNDSINDGIPIVILIQYGHGTKNGGYVSGVDFINPAIQSVMNKIADSIWKEVTKV